MEDALAEMTRRIVTALNPERVILFGSWAYGSPTADSDVDLLVILATEAGPVDRYMAVSNLFRPRLFPMDILVYTPEEIEQRLHRVDPFIHEVLPKGRVLYEHPR